MSLMFLASAVPAASEQAVPPMKKDCSLCHALNKEGTMATLKLPVNDLCLSCHPERGGPTEHPVGVTPQIPVPPLPLYGGEVTCVTCHEPHGLTGLRYMLRAEPGRLCTYCHQK